MMRITLALSTVLVVMLAVSAGTPSARAQEAPTNFVRQAICSPDGLSVHATFDLPTDNEVDEILALRGRSGEADEIWVDLSLFDNGFARGTFIGSGPFDDNGAGFVWEGLVPGRLHLYRLNAFVDNRWIELGRGRFDTPDCVGIDLQSCEPGADTTSVLFRLPLIHSAPQAALETWLDLSIFNNGFGRGTFIGVGPFAPPANTPSPPPEQRYFQWFGIRPGVLHFYRLNVLLEGFVWDTQRAGAFLSLDCRGLPVRIEGG